MSVALTLSRVYKSLADYAADQSTGVPTAGIPFRRTANAREDAARCLLTDRAPVVRLADFVFYNLRNVAVENSRLSALVESLRHAQFKGYDREHCGREVDAVAERWGCAPDRLLAEAIAAVAGCLDADMLRAGVGCIKERVEKFTDGALGDEPTLGTLRAALVKADESLGPDLLDADIQRKEAELDALRRARTLRETRKRAFGEISADLETLAAVVEKN